ncbi:MAG: histidinol-phosphate transaminase [Zoogloeaceae bacterium]|jgi:histidinol-phosphate aminotransferase|nr:histidinol-phosphate transaminase [Zoogloeaceae bacterium]
MSAATQALSYIQTLSPYQPGKPITALARELGIPAERIVKLASNENPLGMSPKGRQAVIDALSGVARYPDQYDLLHVLAERHGIKAERLILGNGSNDVLDLVARTFLDTGRSSVFSQYAFAVYPIATRSVGAEPIAVAARDFGHDLTAMLAAIRPDTAVVFIANPNNPTGTLLSESALRHFLREVPRNVIVVLDEAYTEYLAPEQRFDATAWTDDFSNLIVCRTFSKIYGMAGLRIGYAVAAAPVADLINRVRQPFNCNNLALAAAIAALDDTEFLRHSYDSNRAGMAQLTAGIGQLGRPLIPSHGNFVTFKAGDTAEETVAVNHGLLTQGVIVRPLVGYQMAEWLRVTIGTPEENARFLEVLGQIAA